MLRFSSSYVKGDQNFVIQNLDIPYQHTYERDPLICIMKNIIQRGTPTRFSNILFNKLGVKSGESADALYFSDINPTVWSETILGDEKTGYNPALHFYDNVWKEELVEYSFVRNLVLPECPIHYIVSDSGSVPTKDFAEQRVDFFIPQAKLVIEIDGGIREGKRNQDLDRARVQFLSRFGVKTVRISTEDYRRKNNAYLLGVENIKSRLARYGQEVEKYRPKSTIEYHGNEMKAAATMRWQLFLLSMLEVGKLTFTNDEWSFEIIDEEQTRSLELAAEDLFEWFCHISKLLNRTFAKPKINVNYVKQFSGTSPMEIDFSLNKRWTDEHMQVKTRYFIRTDYLQNINHFQISAAEPVAYDIVEDGKDSDIPSLNFLLENIFGFPKFQNGQLQIVLNAMRGKDTIGLLPTGGGKSLCYQFVAYLQPCVSYVIVPIISLMRDQIYNLHKMSLNRVNSISSAVSATDKKVIQEEFSEGKFQLLIVSPERFQVQAFRDYLTTLNTNLSVAWAVIDEAHCMSEWGHDFRTSYLQLCTTISRYSPSTRFLGLTATASPKVLDDIVKEMKINRSNVKTVSNYTREELHFRPFILKSQGANEKIGAIKELLIKMKHKAFNEEDGLYNQSGLIFTLHKNGKFGCFDVSQSLSQFLGFHVPWYAGEQPKNALFSSKVEFDKYKNKIQDEFKENKYPLLVSTKAFGMGVDKANIRYTIHFGLPGSVESFYQEAGRAGRDKKKAISYLFYSPDAIEKQNLNTLFSFQTEVETIQKIQLEHSKYQQGDVLRNFFLWMNNIHEVDIETEKVLKVFEACAEPEIQKMVTGRSLDMKKAELEKVLYRLFLLGVVEDWTVEEWNDHGKFHVTFGDFGGDSWFDSLNEYIQRYEYNFDVKNLNTAHQRYQLYQSIMLLECSSLEKAVRILIQWTHDNVFYSRKTSLKNLVDWTSEYSLTKDHVEFKRKIETYFKITADTDAFEEIISSPNELGKWFEIIWTKERQIRPRKQIEEAIITISRFLESYRFNPGLNFASGFLRLINNEFDHLDGRERMKEAFKEVAALGEEKQQELLSNTLQVGSFLSSEQKELLGELIVPFYSEDSLTIHHHLNDSTSRNQFLSDANKRLKGIGEIVYG